MQKQELNSVKGDCMHFCGLMWTDFPRRDAFERLALELSFWHALIYLCCLPIELSPCANYNSGYNDFKELFSTCWT